MHHRPAALALTAGVILTGCAGAPAGDPVAELSSPVAHDDWDPGRGGDAALLSGTWELRDGCLVVVPDYEGFPLVVPVLARDLTRWDADRDVLIYDGVEHTMGEAVAAGGGFGDSGGATIPDACDTVGDHDVFRVQSTSLKPTEG